MFKVRFTRASRGPLIRTGLRKGGFGELYPFLLQAPWALVILFIAANFLALNALFAAGYMLAGGVSGARAGAFTDLFFFSVQTMATIGYGDMAPTSLAANVLVTVEALLGLIGLALVTGLIFAKFSRPAARVRFSQFALVGIHNGVPCLMFRMANERANQIVEAAIHAVMVRRERTLEGQVLMRPYDLEMVRGRNPFFGLSWLAIHLITPQSPLYGCDSRALTEMLAMISVSLVGIDDTYAQTVHARHDYRAGEIVWGARFVDMVYPQENGTIVADFSRIDDYELDPAILEKVASSEAAGAPGAPSTDAHRPSDSADPADPIDPAKLSDPTTKP